MPASCCEASVPAAWAVDELELEPEDERLESVLMGLIPSSRTLNPNVDTAAEAGARVYLRGGAWREIGVGDHELG